MNPRPMNPQSVTVASIDDGLTRRETIDECARACTTMADTWLYRTREGLQELDTERGELAEVNIREFKSIFEGRLYSQAEDGRDVVERPITRVVLGDLHVNRLVGKPLKGVVGCPYVDAAGGLHARVGYDPERQELLHWNDGEVNPEDLSFEESIQIVRKPLSGFAFESPADELAALALCARHLRGPALWADSQPMGVVLAEEMASGKTLLCNIVSTIGAGSSPSVTEWGNTPLMRSMSITSALARRPAVLQFDNVPSDARVDDPFVQALLTTPVGYLSRLSGRGGKSIELNPGQTQFLLTGNRLAFDEETGRRVLLVRLKRATKYTIKDPVGWTRANRALIVSAWLRIIQEWHRNGCPKPPRTLASFGGWNHLVGGPVCHAFPKFAEQWLQQRIPNPVADEIRELFESWPVKNERCIPLTTGEVIALAADLALDELNDAYSRGARSTDERSMNSAWGRKLTALSRQPNAVPGWRLEKPNRRAGSRGYRPIEVSQVSYKCHSEKQGSRATGDTCDTSDTLYPTNHSTPLEQNNPIQVSQVSQVSEQRGEGVKNGDTSDDTTWTSVIKLEPTPLPGVAAAVEAMAQRGLPVEASEWRHACDSLRKQLRADVSRAKEAIKADGNDSAAHANLQRATARMDGLRAYGDVVGSRAAQGGRVRSDGWRRTQWGRLVSEGPMFQSITKQGGLRATIAAPNGMKLLVADWSSSHLWVLTGRIAQTGPDLRLLRQDVESGTVYDAMAANLDVPRSAGKMVALGIINGLGTTGIVDQLAARGHTVSKEAASTARDTFIGEYRLAEKLDYLNGTSKRGKQADGRGPHWQLPSGRSFTIPNDRQGRKEQYRRTAWWLQLVEAEAMDLALVAAEAAGLRPILSVYDELVCEVPAVDAARSARKLAMIMDRALGKATGHERSLGKIATKVTVQDNWAKPPAIAPAEVK